jgi:hypothetical protein
MAMLVVDVVVVVPRLFGYSPGMFGATSTPVGLRVGQAGDRSGA